MIRVDPRLREIPDGTDPRCHEPSPVPGLSRLAFDEYAETIRWFAKLTAAEVFRMARADFERDAALLRLGGGAREE